MDHDAVIIEVGLNEAVSPAVHPHVPQRPRECAADARRCAEAGASVVHWHAVDERGVQRLADAELYGPALDAIGDCVIGYPSYPIDVPDTVDDRLAHCFALREKYGMEIAPVDVASVNIVVADAAGRAVAPLEPAPGFDVARNSLPFVVDALARYRAAGLVATVAAFDVGSTRAISALARAGLLDQPILLKIFLWESPLIGPRPSVRALDLHLDQLSTELDVEWLVVPYGMTESAAVEKLARAALERGGGVRVGIGDSPHAFPEATNPQLVEVVARWAADAGRPVATVDALRSRLGTSRP
jgi:3-keto-5-aminohexanoate cleavage enzyme